MALTINGETPNVKYTINGKDLNEVSLKEALLFCHTHYHDYIGNGCDQRQFDCLIEILDSGTIDVSELPDYGMSDQDFE